MWVTSPPSCTPPSRRCISGSGSACTRSPPTLSPSSACAPCSRTSWWSTSQTCGFISSPVRFSQPRLYSGCTILCSSWIWHLYFQRILVLNKHWRWIMRGFSGHFPPSQLLYLWDLVLAYDSMEVFPLLAASILSFRYGCNLSPIISAMIVRKDNLLRVNNVTGVEAVLADLSSLPILPLLQLALARTWSLLCL